MDRPSKVNIRASKQTVNQAKDNTYFVHQKVEARQDNVPREEHANSIHQENPVADIVLVYGVLIRVFRLVLQQLLDQVVFIHLLVLLVLQFRNNDLGRSFFWFDK